MRPEYASATESLAAAMADRWWAIVVRGIAAILFGVLTLVAPRTDLLAIVFVFGAYAIADGVLTLILAWRDRGREQAWGWLVAEGVVSLAAGVAALVWPGLTAIALLGVIIAWALLTGIAEIAAAVRLRRQVRGEWLLVASGVLSIAFAALLFFAPAVGILALMWTIGAYAIVFGALLVGLGLRLRSWRSRAEERRIPPEGVPAGA